MKRIYLTAFSLLGGLSAWAQLANGGMEDWNKILLYEHPVMATAVQSSNSELFYINGEINVTAIQRPGEGTNGEGSLNNNDIKPVIGEDRAVRISTAMVENEPYPGYFIVGDTPDDGGEVPAFAGGIDLEDTEVTGIRLDVRYELPQGAPGMVMLQFKANGEPVGYGNFDTGTSVYQLEGQQRSWTTMEFVLDEPLGAVPDQLVVAVASADLMSGDYPFAEGGYIDIDNLELVNSEDIVPGGQFNSWAMIDPVMVPDNSVADIHPDNRNYAQSTDAFAGALALQVFTGESYGYPNIGSVVFGAQGSEYDIVPTIAIGPEMDLLSFQYKYDAMEDLAEARIVLFDAEDLEEPVFEDVIELEPAAEYTLVEYHLENLLEDNMIDNGLAYIEFRSGSYNEGMSPELGSSLLVDEVKLEDTHLNFEPFVTALTPGNPGGSAIAPGIIPPGTKPTVTALTNGVSKVKSYPNPTMGRLTFSFDTFRGGKLRVFNESGAMVGSKAYGATRSLIYDMSQLPSGTYTFRFYHGEDYAVSKVVKI